MKKSPKSPKKQSAKITKLKMRVGEITSLLLQNHPKMVRMRKGGSSGYADLFMSKQLMKGGKMNDDTQTKIVEFLIDVKNIKAVKALKIDIISKLDSEQKILIESELYANKENLYDYNLCNFIDIEKVKEVLKEVREDLITLDIINKFYKLVENNDNLNKESFTNEKPAEAASPSPSPAPAPSPAPSPSGDGAAALTSSIKRHFAMINLKKVKEGEKQKLLEDMFNLWDNIRLSFYVKIFVTNRSDVLDIDNIDNNFNITFKTDITDKDNELKSLNTYMISFLDIYDIFRTYYKRAKDEFEDLQQKKVNETTVDDIQADVDKFQDFYDNIPDIKGKIYAIYSSIDPTWKEKVKVEEEEEAGTPAVPGDRVEGTPGAGGKLPAKYKSLGIAVHILYKKRKYKRTIYVKDKKKTKYCKIDGEYILLSKMKVIA